MGRGSGWVSVSLPPCPTRSMTPEERAEQSAMMEAELERYLHHAELRKLRKERTTPEQRARKAAQDDTRKLRALLREAADAARWERITAALDVYGMQAWGAKEKVAKLREQVTRRTARVYARAAAGCEVSADYLADDSTDALCAEVFTDPAAPVQQ